MELISVGSISSVTKAMILLFFVSISMATAHTTVRKDLTSAQNSGESGENTSSQQDDKLLLNKRAFARSFRQAAAGDAHVHNTGLHRRRIEEQLVDDILKKVKDSILRFTLIVPGDATRNGGGKIRHGDSMQNSNTFWKNYYVTEQRYWK